MENLTKKPTHNQRNRQELIESLENISNEMAKIMGLEDSNGELTLNETGSLLEYYPFEESLDEVKAKVDLFITVLKEGEKDE